MDKKIKLYTREVEKTEARELAEKFVIASKEIGDRYKSWSGSELSPADTLKMIEGFSSKSSKDFIKDSLLMKYSKVVKQFQNDYAGIQIDKVLDNFTSKEDLEFLDDLMSEMQITLRTFGSISRMVRTIQFEHFIYNDSIEVSRAVKDRIRIAFDVFCANQKQADLADVATQIQKIILNAQKRGVLGKNNIEATVSKLMEVDSGKINYGQIMRY